MLLAIAFWKRNDVPGGATIRPELREEPQQTATSRATFAANWGGVEYRVEPQFEYDLYGMVVSYRQHGDSSRMHRLANDHLNMADICVVWGSDAENEHLDELEFWNGIFTCNVKTDDREAWESFDLTQMSNNHLLSDDADIRERVNGVSIGDQVHVRGVLASYGTRGGSKRGTSTTRDDTGDGACETIFVDEFEIVDAAMSYWRLAMYFALAVIAITLFFHFRRPYRPY